MAEDKKLKELKAKAEGLGINTESLTTADALEKAIAIAEKPEDKNDAEATATLDEQIAEAEEALAVLKEAKTKEEADAEKAKRAEAEKNDKRPKFPYKGRRYRFKKTAPETLNIDGKATKVTTVIKNKEVMTELIEGRNNFIEIVNT